MYTIFVPQVGLEPTRLTTNAPKAFAAAITPSGHNHIRQAFYFQHREIVSYLTLLTTVRVPEDMIFCSPSWNRTTNISLEVRSYIHLTNRPLYLRRDLNPYGQCPQNFKSCVSTDSTTKVYYKDKKKYLFSKTFLINCVMSVFLYVVGMI